MGKIKLNNNDIALVDFLQNCNVEVSEDKKRNIIFIDFEYFSNEYEIQHKLNNDTYHFEMFTEYEEFRGKIEAKTTTLKYNCNFDKIRDLVLALIA